MVYRIYRIKPATASNSRCGLFSLVSAMIHAGEVLIASRDSRHSRRTLDFLQ